VDACERDHSSILAYRHLLNGTNTPFEHTFYPFVSHWTHQLNGDMRYRPVRVPDKIPSHNVKLIEGDFLQEFTEEGVYDAVVTLFFIDMSENIVDFLETIRKVLKVGGLWVNLGRKPSLCHFIFMRMDDDETTSTSSLQMDPALSNAALNRGDHAAF
jgi:carnosine N-methyltransferase